MAEQVCIGDTQPWSEEWDVLPQIAPVLMTQEGDEYSEVTYSTQRAMAADKNKHAVGLSACVSRELLNIITHNRRTEHVTRRTNSLFTVNVSFQTLDVA